MEELNTREGKCPLLDGLVTGILFWKKYFSNPWVSVRIFVSKMNVALLDSLSTLSCSENPIPGSLQLQYDLMGTFIISTSESNKHCLGNNADEGIMVVHCSVLCFPIAWYNVGYSVHSLDRNWEGSVVR